MTGKTKERLLSALLLLALIVAAVPALVQEKGRAVVTGDGYRATFTTDTLGLELELKGADGQHCLATGIRRVVGRQQRIEAATQAFQFWWIHGSILPSRN